MQLKNKHIVVVGLGRTGLAVARFLVGRQAEVVVTDMAAESALEGQLKMIKDLGIRYELGMHRSETFENADLIVISPGVPETIEPIIKARSRGVQIIGEIELATLTALSLGGLWLAVTMIPQAHRRWRTRNESSGVLR